MPAVVKVFPELFDSSQVVTLGSRAYRLRLYWRDRLAAWFLDLRTLEGGAIALGRRLSTGWCPLVGLVSDEQPEGYLYVRGPDEYSRLQLGRDVQLVFYGPEEVQRGLTSASPALTVTRP